MHVETMEETGGKTKAGHQVRLTSAEVSNLWTQYMSDSASACFTRHFLEHAKDQEVRAILEFALALSRTHMAKSRQFLAQEGYPSPVGFSEDADIINLNAPALFSDMFLLEYFYVMTIIGLTGYAGAISTSIRSDQRSYFAACNMEAMTLFNRIVDLMLEKGVATRPPNLNVPDQVEMASGSGYMKGWFGNRRALNAVEISSLFYNMEKLEVKVVVEMAFGQVAQSKDVRKILLEGAKICREQFKLIGLILAEDNLPSPRSWESELSSSTISPFSDKLMLYHVVMLVSASASYYGAGLSVSQRKDLAALYAKLITEIGFYAEDGSRLLMKNGWFEQAPGADDRKALAKQK
ncbi:DUF3231 family protein [Paenibacillus soyae]|uniref:DUF3231 family protein n=1 Tax=Paenibacillus soyae TaxID=2969249 RepID=A0A9X2MWI4_9BACL|nr:DUF3231 family protein [Paenibacillus soyae]MCR2807632.1 DUF3231 family protein [Paenibacillus soyae]